MKLLLLRGMVPRDRNPKEIMFKNLSECDDIYTHMAEKIGDDVEIWYWGGEREFWWSEKCVERWIPDFNKYKSDFKPDVIWARGGFEEYLPVLKRFPNAYKIYYSAGRGTKYIPKDGTDYNLVLCDSKSQLDDVVGRGFNGKLWIKPAAPIFKPISVEKKYDVCFIANGTQAKIKNIKWVYKTVPKELSVLHLGNKNAFKIPGNVKCRRVTRSEMPTEISKCRVGIIPYGKTDSAPRALVEMLACGVPVVVLSGVRFWQSKYSNENSIVKTLNTADFWDMVKKTINGYGLWGSNPSRYYEKELNVDKASEYLKSLIFSGV